MHKKSSFFGFYFLVLSLLVATNAQAQTNLEQRVERLERMLENPVLIQLSRRLGEQRREIQQLQDENDRLKRDFRQLESKLERYSQVTEQRLLRLDSAQNDEVDQQKPQRNVTKQGDDTSLESSLPAALATNTEKNVDDSSAQRTPTNPTQKASQNLAINKADEAKIEKRINAAKNDSSEEGSKSNAQTPINTRAATATETEAYKAAFALMQNSKYQASIEAFQSFLKKYPQSDLASNSAYWSGEGYLIQGETQKALQNFEMIIKRYPDSVKVPDALLRAGDSYDRLGQTEQAKALYSQLITDFPQSRSGANAKKRMAAYD